MGKKIHSNLFYVLHNKDFKKIKLYCDFSLMLMRLFAWWGDQTLSPSFPIPVHTHPLKKSHPPHEFQSLMLELLGKTVACVRAQTNQCPHREALLVWGMLSCFLPVSGLSYSDSPV